MSWIVFYKLKMTNPLNCRVYTKLILTSLSIHHFLFSYITSKFNWKIFLGDKQTLIVNIWVDSRCWRVQPTSASADVRRDTKITEISHLPLYGYSCDFLPLDGSVVCGIILYIFGGDVYKLNMRLLMAQLSINTQLALTVVFSACTQSHMLRYCCA